MHPVDKARIIQEGMRAGEKMLHEERMTAQLHTNKATTKDKKSTVDHGAIRIKTKNVNSIKRDQGDREELVMNHLRQTQKNWDIWILTETWRDNQREVVDFQAEEESDEDNQQKKMSKAQKKNSRTATKKKDPTSESPRRVRQHSMFACGGKKARGVAIIINARHAKGAELIAVNENICAVDVKLHGKKTCVIAVYMPHAGKCSDEQEAVYHEITKLMKTAKENKRMVILAGDFNAVVGKTSEDDYAEVKKNVVPQACGNFGLGTRNQKGQRLHQFCSQQNLIIGNTMFDKPAANLWTHRGIKTGGEENLRQIDFIMVGRKYKWRLMDVDTEEELSVGNDHRTVTATLKLKKKPAKITNKNHKRETVADLKAWQPRDKESYAADLDKAITTECCKNPKWKTKSNTEKIDSLETILILTAAQHTKPTKKEQTRISAKDPELQWAIAGRKHYRQNKQYKEAAQMAKIAQRLTKKNSNQQIKEKIDEIVEKFKDLKWIHQIKKGGRRKRAHCMVHPKGKIETSPKGMANVFRDFYEDLYKSRQDPAASKTNIKPNERQKQQQKLHSVTEEEVDKALHELKSGKCKDTKNVTAEILKHAGPETKKIIAAICTDVLRGGAVPEPWKKNCINVLHKSGTTQDAANYRPICILDITYKVLARIIYSRIIKKINEAQSVDQAGFMKFFSTDDHLLSSTILIERAWKNNRPLWICAVDFKKAFDSVIWDSIWMALRESKVEEGYIYICCRTCTTTKKAPSNSEYNLMNLTSKEEPNKETQCQPRYSTQYWNFV